ncbi:MAG: metallophosphoesterase, partial [Nitrosopumilales archaeon]|nr:metallophosphoesterase [Nitrosopumilales archaeon]
LEKPRVIDDELFRLSVNALGSEKAASFAIKELLPLLTADLLKEATQIVIENYEHYKKEKQK